jgi:hypothetical protein
MAGGEEPGQRWWTHLSSAPCMTLTWSSGRLVRGHLVGLFVVTWSASHGHLVADPYVRIVCGLGDACPVFPMASRFLDVNGYLKCYCIRVRFFNTAGPCVPELNYMLPPEPRLPGARQLIEQGQYFRRLPAEFMPPERWPDAPPDSVLFEGLRVWARACPRPLALFFDEIDSLTGAPLLGVLSQLRDGFRVRPDGFPASVALCGLRDIRDYRMATGQDPNRRSTSSPFNIAVESLRMTDFTHDQVAELYAQHTAETGQEFTPEAVDRAFEYSQGQPWLVNSLAREITIKIDVKPPEPITAEHVDEAKDRLILARATHLEYLADRLAESRVRKIIEPLIAGGLIAADPTYDDDLSYVRDLGLIGSADPPAIANMVYREVIVRVLGSRARGSVLAEPRSFLQPDGSLDFPKVLTEFAAWWRQFGELLVKGEAYHEVAPQLIFIAYLTRIVNGGGFVDCEYGVGRGRIDVIVRKPHTGPDGKPALQREAVEIKVRRPNRRYPSCRPRSNPSRR